mmetsp:Transcript_15340/g.24151  ORF Transcript_15340/g.24151 Transcript_15340/m.24151 type:complete len:428 (+) Transcript_15340:25-1308(+)
MHGRTSKGPRRRYLYTENDRTKWLTVGALLFASSAILGYLYGRYSEKSKNLNRSVTQLSGTAHNKANDEHKTADNNAHSDLNALILQHSHSEHAKHMHYERDYRIVIYGDSTTWGYDPDKQTRLSLDERYPCVLERLLNAANTEHSNTRQQQQQQCERFRVEVISEGLNGRTIAYDDTEDNKKNQRRNLSMNGLQQLLPILYSHKPVDIMIVMLGINDCKSRFTPSASKIAANMHRLIEQCIHAEIWPIEQDNIAHGPCLIVVSPASMRQLTAINEQGGWNQSSINVSQSLHTHYEQLPGKFDKSVMLSVVNANEYIETGSDSVHLDAENNRKLAVALAPIVEDMIAKIQEKARRFSVPSFTTASLKHHQSNNKLVEVVSPSSTALDEEEEEEREESLSELEHQRNADHDMMQMAEAVSDNKSKSTT